MSVNSSSSPYFPLFPLYFPLSKCFNISVDNIVFTGFTVTNILLLLPFSIIILHVGHQRWRQQRSASTRHSDVIVYHMTAMEMISMLASIIYCVGIYTDLLMVAMLSSHLVFVSLCGQTSFHTLTCVERYLAVVHPITYMQMRKGSKVRIRNTIIWSIWLQCLSQTSFMIVVRIEVIFIVFSTHQALSLAVVCFCCLSVLRVLKCLGPGEGGRGRVDQSKQRAFNTIMAIMAALFFKFGGNLACIVMSTSEQLNFRDRCVVIGVSFWFGLPSSVALPLLFLHRAGKLACCKENTGAGRRPS